MSYLVLARKYRPRSFGDLVGQEPVVRALEYALSHGRLHHAYLFTGTRGVGKTTLARILARCLNCEGGVTAQPCGKCSACREISEGRFIDLIEVDAATNTRVDEMRQLLENAVYAPTRGRYKTYVIDEVHMLSNSAFNAMLKTLEEPPDHLKFILATTDPQKIPVTVLSRCMQFGLKNLPPTMIAGHLASVLDIEKITYESSALKLISVSAQGSMRDALSLLDQAIAHGSGCVEEASLRQMLGAVDRRYLLEMLSLLANGDVLSLLEMGASLADRGLMLESVLHDMAWLFHRLALALVVPTVLDDDDEEDVQLRALLPQFDAATLQRYYQIVIHGESDLKYAPDPATGFSMTLLRLCTFSPQGTVVAVSSDVDKGDIPSMKARASSPLLAVGRQEEIRPAQRRLLVPPVVTPPIVRCEETVLDDDPPPALVVESSVVSSVQHVVHEVSSPVVDVDIWSQWVLSLSGLPRQVAENAEFVSYDDGILLLRVSKAVQGLLSVGLSKLEMAIAKKLGSPVRVRTEIGTADKTVASQRQSLRNEQQSRAEEAIYQDSFVQTLLEQCDGVIESGSIKLSQ